MWVYYLFLWLGIQVRIGEFFEMKSWCNVGQVANIDSEVQFNSSILSINWSLWIEEFLDRLFSLFVNLEPGLQSG